MGFYVETVGGTLGAVGTPGAPILHFRLKVTRGFGSDERGHWPVSGSANITQAIGGPAGDITIDALSGASHAHGPDGMIIWLTGSFGIPPSDLVMPFWAMLVVKQQGGQWSGTGAFTYVYSVLDVPVHATMLLEA